MGVPGGGDDEFRSVVFDESFVRAARIQEFSAHERLSGAEQAVRPVHPWSRGLGHRQALVLVILIALAFGTAVYLGVRHPYRPGPVATSGPLHVTLVPLTPQGAVPAVVEQREPAADARYPAGAAGITLPAARAPGTSPTTQVRNALNIVQGLPDRLLAGGVGADRRRRAPGARPARPRRARSSSTTASPGPPTTAGTRRPAGWCASTRTASCWPTRASGSRAA